MFFTKRVFTRVLGLKKKLSMEGEGFFKRSKYSSKTSNDIMRVIKKQGSYFFTISTVLKGKKRKIVAKMQVDVFDPKLFRLFRIYVDPGFRNKGYGTSLMSKFLDFLEERNATVALVVKPFEEDRKELSRKEFIERRKDLVRWYSKFGFKLLKSYTEKQFNYSDMSIHMIRKPGKQSIS